MACPFFYPAEKTYSVGWAFPARLPLGAGFCGTCRAANEEVVPTETELRDFCNLGYAGQCPRLPADRRADCARFGVARDDGQRIALQYVCERDHAPVEHGAVEFDCEGQRWLSKLEDACLQKQVEAYLSTYLDRRPRKSAYPQIPADER